MKKQARIDVRDYLDLNTAGDLSDIVNNNVKGNFKSLFNVLSDEGQSSADALARIVGDESGAVHRTPMKIKGLGSLQKVIDAYNQYYPEMNTQIQLGMVDAARNQSRAKALNPGFLTKILGKINLNEDIANILENSRTDHFMPLSDTVHVFSQNPSILAHELGHAADFTYRHKGSPGRMILESDLINKIPLLGGLGTLDQEMAATNNAWKALQKAGVSDDMMRNLSRDLSGAGGTYAGSIIGGKLGLLLGALGGAATGDPVNSILGGGIGMASGSAAGLEAGALTGRNVGKYVDIPKYLLSSTLPEPLPVSERLKIHAGDIWKDIKSGNILAYPRDTFNSMRYTGNDIKEMLLNSKLFGKLKNLISKVR